jgi:hypothetical protein
MYRRIDKYNGVAVQNKRSNAYALIQVVIKGMLLK